MVSAPARSKSATARSNRGKDLRVGSTGAARVPKHADPPACGTVPLQERHVSRGNLAIRLRSRPVRRVDIGDDVQQSYKIGDGAGRRCRACHKVQPCRSEKPTPNLCANRQAHCWRRDFGSSQTCRSQGPRYRSSRLAPIRCRPRTPRSHRRGCRDCAQNPAARN
jgi:hypothetical protein